MTTLNNMHLRGLSLNEVGEEIPYVRVACNYYKKLWKEDRFGIFRAELKPWKKEEISQDHGKDFLKKIPIYDDFTIKPDNLNYLPVYYNCLNLYSPFRHSPREGDWKWTKQMLEHVFGNQYELGLRYMQILYLHPDKSTVILALVSKERETGKTTFLNYLVVLFGSNMVVLSPTDLERDFNSQYATKNIIAIEETFLDRKPAMEKLKAITTAKQLTVNEKYVAPYNVPFFGKIIMTSNNENNFALIDPEEVRFFVRKLHKPEFLNPNIEQDLINEIPAFLHYLRTLAPVDWSVGRSGFKADELRNESLSSVVDESRSSTYKELRMHIEEYFYENDIKEFLATPTDIKTKFFSDDVRVRPNYIGKVLKEDFKKTPEEMQRYCPLIGANKTGTPYRFLREEFVKCKPTKDSTFTT